MSQPAAGENSMSPEDRKVYVRSRVPPIEADDHYLNTFLKTGKRYSSSYHFEALRFNLLESLQNLQKSVDKYRTKQDDPLPRTKEEIVQFAENKKSIETAFQSSFQITFPEIGKLYEVFYFLFERSSYLLDKDEEEIARLKALISGKGGDLEKQNTQIQKQFVIIAELEKTISELQKELKEVKKEALIQVQGKKEENDQLFANLRKALDELAALKGEYTDRDEQYKRQIDDMHAKLLAILTYEGPIVPLEEVDLANTSFKPNQLKLSTRFGGSKKKYIK